MINLIFHKRYTFSQKTLPKRWFKGSDVASVQIECDGPGFTFCNLRVTERAPYVTSTKF